MPDQNTVMTRQDPDGVAGKVAFFTSGNIVRAAPDFSVMFATAIP